MRWQWCREFVHNLKNYAGCLFRHGKILALTDGLPKRHQKVEKSSKLCIQLHTEKFPIKGREPTMKSNAPRNPITRFARDKSGSVTFEMMVLVAGALLGALSGADFLGSVTDKMADVVILELDRATSQAVMGSVGFSSK